MAKAKIKRNQKKCERYRATVGKPRGPGVKGNKRGKGWVRMDQAKKPKVEKPKAEKPKAKGAKK
jgi:hypothetical protein